MVKSIAVAAAALAVTVSSAYATPIVYHTTYSVDTSVDTPAASGTVASGGGSTTIGGLSTGGNLPITGGSSSAAGVATLPAIPGTLGSGVNYLLSFTITANSTKSPGDIWDVILGGGAYGTGTSIGTSPVACITVTTPTPNDCSNNFSDGTISVVVPAGTTGLSFSVTDLLEQYAPASQTDTLPGYLNPADASMDGGTVSSNIYATSNFSLQVNAALDPEPASIGLFTGALMALGVLRRRRERSV